METLRLRLTGLSGLVMHNGQLADPLNEFSRAIKSVAGRRQKTDADHLEVGRLEWLGGLYIDQGRPCLPGEVLEACLMAGARRSKQGKVAAAGIICPGNYPLDYVGPLEPLALWEDEGFRLRVPVKVGQARVMRTRPVFRAWSCQIDVEYAPSQVNRGDVLKWADVAGAEIGVGDWRPRFGRFAVTAI